uniref:Secreted protein n=1 Tax=Heterorhabditis bacteriophora TaxID=37862 RepID=A0A1I7WG01_HETBA
MHCVYFWNAVLRKRILLIIAIVDSPLSKSHTDKSIILNTTRQIESFCLPRKLFTKIP